jgi:AraC-like DNA-binding protein
MRPHDTTSRDALRVLLRGLDALGLESQAELRRLGIAGPDDDAAGPVDRRAYCALWERAAAGREDLGLDLAALIEPGTVGPVEWLAATAPTLGAGLEQLARHGQLLHAGGTYALQPHEGQVHFTYDPGGGDVLHRAQVDWAFAYLVRRMQRTLPRGGVVVEVRMQYPRPARAASRSRMEEAFGAPVHFGAALNELVLRREVLAQPLEMRDPELHAALQAVCSARRGRERTVVGQAEAVVARALERERVPALEEVARALGLGSRTLQRELLTAGLSFRALLLRARMNLARRWLSMPGHTVTEVAYRLAYSEPSSFLRAYRLHFGQRPSGAAAAPR